MDMIHRVIEGVSFGISLIGIVVVLWGILEAVIAFLKSKLRGVGTSISMDPAMRQELSAHLLLGLEIFIAADIISSVASPTWEKVGILGAVVGIRTVLSYFLTMEMEKEKTMENGKWRMENSQSMHTLFLFATIYYPFSAIQNLVVRSSQAFLNTFISVQ